MRITLKEKIGSVTITIILVFSGVCCLYPFVNIAVISVSSIRAVQAGEVYLWPVEFTIDVYKEVIRDGQIFAAMKNTVILTVVGTALCMASTILSAYALSKKRLMGRGVFMGIIVFTMMFSGGMIPSFLLIRSLGLMNSYWALWLGGLQSSYNMIVLRTFFQGIPDSLEEAAQIDGAGDPYILVRIVLPLSGAALATITLFYAVGWWNTYFSAMMYITTTTKQTLMVKLRQMLDAMQVLASQAQGGVSEGSGITNIAGETFKAATILVSMLPIMCVYPFLQKYFTKGVMIGSVKE
jgi:putative aldouronate transport system permease protein